MTLDLRVYAAQHYAMITLKDFFFHCCMLNPGQYVCLRSVEEFWVIFFTHTVHTVLKFLYN